MFQRIAIVNRGEAAMRLIHAVRDLNAQSGPDGHRKIELHFDYPVDVVRSDLFSNLRQRVRATLDATGRSHRRTSDGAPQLVLDREGG